MRDTKRSAQKPKSYVSKLTEIFLNPKRINACELTAKFVICKWIMRIHGRGILPLQLCMKFE